MIRLLMCIFGLHGAREIDYTNDHKEICVCRECLKKFKSPHD
jgi:hypothetical protein